MQATTVQTAEAPSSAPAGGRAPGSRRARRLGWTASAIVLVGLGAGVVAGAGTRPGYDPYGWLVWGKLAIHWQLDTNGAPSWKPLTFLFTTPYAITGHDALWLWMVTAVAVSLSGAVFAWRIAARLTGAQAPRWAAGVAGLVAAVMVLGIRDYSHYVLSVQSDPMIVSLCLAAIDCQLSGRRRWALWLWVLAGLGRPEAWPFLGAYGVWLWRRDVGLRRMVLAAWLVIPLLWFGIPALTAKSWFVAGENALHSPRELHQSKITGTIDRLFDLQETTVWLAALAGVSLAAWRRERMAGILAAGVIGWLVIEIAFVLHGWPGVPRYLFEPVGVAAVLAGVFVGRVLAEAARLPARLRPRGRPGRLGAGLGALAGALAIGAVIVPLAPAAQSRWRIERRDLAHEQARTAEINRLGTIVERMGTARLLACGAPNIPIGYQSVLAWDMGVRIGALYIDQPKLRLHPVPLLNIYPVSGGWKVFPSHIPPAQAARCAGLKFVYRTRA